MRIRQRERQRSADLGAKLLQTAIFRANLTSSLEPSVGAGGPTFSRATKAWGFNELGYLEEVASGCVFFGGARLVRNLLAATEDASSGSWSKSTGTTAAQATDSSGGSTAMRFTYGSSQSHLMRQSPTVTSRDAMYCAQFRFKTDATHDWWRVVIYDGGGNQCRVWFNAQTGTIGNTVPSGSGVFVSATLTDVGGGWFALRLVGSPGVAGTGVVYAQFSANDGDGITTFANAASGDAITIEKPSLVDVTGYDASYVPEYVSVGVEASPYFGAGIDGAKYFSTDYTGGRALTNLIGFRREAAATNNLLYCRDLRYLATNRWYATAQNSGDSEKIVNGTFPTDTSSWIASGATLSVVGGRLRIASTGAAIGMAYQAANLVIGKCYNVVVDTWFGTGSHRILVGNGGGSGTMFQSSAAGVASNTQIIGSFIATQVAVTLTCIQATATLGAYAEFDNISIKESAVQVTQATGLDGIANTATTLTATAADAIILQPITLASADRCASAYVKRRTGTGTISFTQDGGGTWTDITSQINSSTWSRVQITSTLADPSVGFKISTIGDEIDVDCVQNEAGSVATSPIITTSAAVTRNAEILTYQVSGNIDFTVGTAIGSVQSSGSSALRYLINVGTAYSYISSAQANTEWRVTDGTNTTSISGLQDLTAGRVKRAISWSGGSINITGDGVTPVSGTFDGTFGDGSTISIGLSLNGTVRDVAIWPVALTNAQLQALTA